MTMNRTGKLFSLPLISGLAAFALVDSANATYSIVAADQKTQQLGGAGTSCVGSLSVRIIYGVAIGHGAVHAQATLNIPARERAVLRLSEDVHPIGILAEITFVELERSTALPP